MTSNARVLKDLGACVWVVENPSEKIVALVPDIADDREQVMVTLICLLKLWRLMLQRRLTAIWVCALTCRLPSDCVIVLCLR